MKLFGRYLVEKGLVSEEALLQALVRQMESLPSVQSVVQDSKLLTVQEQLKIFERQWKTGTEYRRAAVESNLWTEKLQQEVRHRLVALRKPLGQVFVELGHLTLDQLTRALDEYIAQSGAKSSRTTPVPVALAPEKVVSSLSTSAYLTLFDEDMHLRLSQADAQELRALIPPLMFLSKRLGLTESHKAWVDLDQSLAPSVLESLWILRTSLVERKAA